MKSSPIAILLVTSLSTFAYARALAPADLSLYAVDKQVHAQSPNAKRIGDLVQGASEKTDWMVPLAAGECYVIAARGDDNVHRISLLLWAPDGKHVATERPHGATATMRYCSTWNGTFHATAKIEGHGAYVVGTYAMNPMAARNAKMPPPLVGAPAPPPVLPAAAPAPQTTYVPVVTPVFMQPTYVSPAPATRTVVIVPGTNGTACQSSIDCGSGELCKEDSTGYKVCMGSSHSMRGSACSSSIDCGFGMFCKEDSDGYKMCM